MAPTYNVGMIMSLVLVTIWPAAAKPSNFIFFQPDEMRAESLGESSLHCMSQWAGRSSGAWFLLVSSSRSTSFRLPHAVHLVPSHPFSTVRLTQYFSLCSTASRCLTQSLWSVPNLLTRGRCRLLRTSRLSDTELRQLRSLGNSVRAGSCVLHSL